jgi:hypothetical protein
MLKIQNLSKEIDMTAVRGGDSGTAVDNGIAQLQNMWVPVCVAGNNGPTNSFVHVNGSQKASVSNDLTNGDRFFALLGEYKPAA